MNGLRVDKLAMMEELEMAIESDKAKPQVGQLSDLGLVEMTRHRQGQAISEIFAKRCPHCQGNGYIMEDIKFASATSEGEYRAKAAKLKLPMGNKKKFNNNKFNKPEEVKEQQQSIQEEKLEQVSENPSVTAQTEVNEIKEEKEVKDISYKDAFLIGCSQVFALIPGFSRSGTTIACARALKINREDAAKFSFYLSAPVVLGACLLQFIKGEAIALIAANMAIFLVGILVAFVTGLICIKFLLQYLKKHDFKVFMIYRILLAVAVILLVTFRG